MPSAIQVLRADHQSVESLFTEFESLGKRDPRRRQLLVQQMVRELSVHAVVEEQAFYPALRRKRASLAEPVLQALEEHHVVKWLVSELQKRSPADERFEAKTRVLIENVRQHVKQEEKVLFAELKKALSARELEELGEVLLAFKKVAPTRPHPRAPDTPPGNLLAGAASGVLDRALDLVSGSSRIPGQLATRRAASRKKSAPRAAAAARQRRRR